MKSFVKKDKYKQASNTGEGLSVKINEQEVIDRVWKIADPLIETEGMELVHVEYRREPGGRVLRIYLDKPGGVTLDDCVYISRQLGDILDINLENVGPYHLEVSSPGLDRPLGKIEDFDRFKGNMAKITTREPVEGRKNFRGELQGVSDNVVKIDVDGKTVFIEHRNITKAKLLDYNGVNGC